MRSNAASLVCAARNTLQQGLRGAGRGPRNMRGITLIELMIVVVVLSILTSIAVGSYRRHLIRTNRTEAATSLLRIQVAQEKHYLQNNTYTADLNLLGVPARTQSGYYDLAVAPPDLGNLATGFVATATAIGGQADDADCQTMEIDDRGRKDSAPSDQNVCWR